MSDRIRTVIADDEPLARERLYSLLTSEPDIEVVDQCADGIDTVAAILRHRPDLLFLDIEMPGVNGFEVLKKLDPQQMPFIIFVTAYDKYALQAFEAHALDYLLKPFDRERFAAALGQARNRISQHRSVNLSARFFEMFQRFNGDRRVERIVVKSGGRIVFLRTDEVDWIEAAGNYVSLHVGRESHLLRETLTAFEEKLAPGLFVRIHRSAIVNVERIRELKPTLGGDCDVVLRDGTQLTLSRNYRNRLQQLLGECA
jgi:two-component system LytT family response regulator